MDGKLLGLIEGDILGCKLGTTEGVLDAASLGCTLGSIEVDGSRLGSTLGRLVTLGTSDTEGSSDGDLLHEGKLLTDASRDTPALTLGGSDGDMLGVKLGVTLGTMVGCVLNDGTDDGILLGPIDREGWLSLGPALSLGCVLGSTEGLDENNVLGTKLGIEDNDGGRLG